MNPLFSLPGSLFISSPFEGRGGLIETGGLFDGGGLFNLEKTMVSVLKKKLEYKVEKLKKKKVGGHAAEDQNKKLPVSILPMTFRL